MRLILKLGGGGVKDTDYLAVYIENTSYDDLSIFVSTQIDHPQINNN